MRARTVAVRRHRSVKALPQVVARGLSGRHRTADRSATGGLPTLSPLTSRSRCDPCLSSAPAVDREKDTMRVTPSRAPSGRARRRLRTRALATGVALVTAAPFALIAATGPAAAQAPVGQGFNLNASDLRFILKQIKIAEQHADTYSASNPARPCEVPRRRTRSRAARSETRCRGACASWTAPATTSSRASTWSVPPTEVPAAGHASRSSRLRSATRTVRPGPRSRCRPATPRRPAPSSTASRASSATCSSTRPDATRRRRSGRRRARHRRRPVRFFIPNARPTSACRRRSTRGSRCSASSSTTASTSSNKGGRARSSSR